MTVITERAEQLADMHLDKSSHRSFGEGHCAMEVVAWLAGEGHTDAPECASRVLRGFTIDLNDRWDDGQRQKLRPLLPRMVGTADDGQDEARSYLALDWLIRSSTPAWLDLAGLTDEAAELRALRRIVDLAAAEAAGPVVRSVQQKADAAWAAARTAARDAARDAARAAAGTAAWDAARTAARDAARDAARTAAGAALKPTVEILQASALDLLDRMIDPRAVAK